LVAEEHPMIDITNEQMTRIRMLCDEYGVVKLELFGSAATDAFDPARSDVDAIAQFAEHSELDYVDRFFGFVEALEELFERPVDLLTQQKFRNAIFQHSVDATRTVIYERPNVEAAA